MAIISPIFVHHASGANLLSDQNVASDSESGTAASASGNADIMTLEYTDNPFEGFLRDLELIAQLSPSDAYHRAQLTLMDKVFDTPEQLSLLSERVKELLDDINNDHALEYSFSMGDFGIQDPDLTPSRDDNSPNLTRSLSFANGI